MIFLTTENFSCYSIYNFTAYNDVYLEHVIKIAIKDLKEFIFENYHKRLGFTKKDSYYLFKKQRKKDLVIFTIKLTKEITDLIKLKKNKDKKSCKLSKAVKKT